MSGKCYSCTLGFSLFKREYGCKNCGFSFCKECVSKKAQIPKCNNESHHVCNKCHAILTGKVKPVDKEQFSPPEAYKKRLAALENKTGSGSTSHTGSSSRQPVKARPHTKNSSLSKEDAAIAERLNKLKESRKPAAASIPTQQEIEQRLSKLKEDKNAAPIPSESDMRARLARLKGQQPSAANKPHVFPVDRRGQQQQVDDLLEEICAEVEIDSHGVSPADDIRGRLDQLQGYNVPASSSGADNNLDKTDASSQSSFVKNIPTYDDTYKPASEEDIDIAEMNKLVAQVAHEMNVDAAQAIDGLKKDKELWNRLQELRKTRSDEQKSESQEAGADATGSCSIPTQGDTAVAMAAGDSESDEENDDGEARAIIERILAEKELDDKLDLEEISEGCAKRMPAPPKDAPTNFQPTDTETESDELPWCCICNADATLRCQGCDDDLYCKRCYRLKENAVIGQCSLCVCDTEGHDRFDMEDHPTIPYKSKT